MVEPLTKPVLGIDSALRKTGLCLYAGPHTRMTVARFPKRKNRDELLPFAQKFLGDFFGSVVPLVAAVEYPPEAIHKQTRSGSPMRYEGAKLGFATATWAAACRALGVPRVVTVDVADWRKIILGSTKGGEEAKAVARLRAHSRCKEAKADLPRNNDEAEAFCIAEWGVLLATGKLSLL